MRSCHSGRSCEYGSPDPRVASGDQGGDRAAEREADDAQALGDIGMGLEHADRARRVGEPTRERHSGRLMIAVRETERGDARVRESLARGDDVWLIGVATEAVQHGRAADGSGVRQMQDPIELGVLDTNPDALCWH